MLTRLLMVTTLDGVIARNNKHNPLDWSSKEDKELYRQTSKEFGVLIMGQNTYDVIGTPLPGRLIIVLTEEKRPDIAGSLERKSGDVKKILADLENRGFNKVLICGGAFVNSLFLKENLINEIQLTVEPKIFGSGLRLFDKIDANIELKLIEIKKLNENTVNLLYKVTRE